MSSDIESSFKFENYKIDKLNFHMINTFGMLEFAACIPENLWKLSISIREPFYIQSKQKYIGGLDTDLYLPNDENGENTEDPLLKLTVGIVGVFSVEEGRFDSESEQQLVKIKIPTILFPYIRTTITSLLANAGFGSAVLPLINISRAAKYHTESSKIKVI